MKKILAP